MLGASQRFTANIQRARALGGLARAVMAVAPPLDVSDLWRAQIVLGVSAFDHFIHELSRLGMIEAVSGVRPQTDAFRRFDIPVSALNRALSGAETPAQWLGDAVKEKHSWLTFQHPDKVADAMRLVSSKALWEEVANVLGSTAADAKRRLLLIIERRNKIAHEADMDPTNPGFRWPISSQLAVDALQALEDTGNAIYSTVG
jgi:hypothetical protein